MDIIKKEIIDRVLEESAFIIKTNKTIRDLSKEFKVSKSTVHKDLHERLFELDKCLFKKVDKIMQEHIATRHIKGGESTRLKYTILKNNI